MKNFIAILSILACLVGCGSDTNPEVNLEPPALPDSPSTLTVPQTMTAGSTMPEVYMEGESNQ